MESVDLVAVGALDDILGALSGTNQQAQRIAESAEGMTGQLGHLSLLVESVAGIAQESAAAAEEMAAQSTEVLSSVQRIAAVSDSVEGEVSAKVRRVILTENDQGPRIVRGPSSFGRRRHAPYQPH